MNMGKRFLLILLSLFVFAGSAFAYSTPRWFKMPVSVYIAGNNPVVVNAFKSWQAASGGAVRFVFRDSKNLESRCNIVVSTVESLPDGEPYLIDRQQTIFGNTDYYVKKGYFYKANIVLARNGGEKNTTYTKTNLRANALRAVGEVIGIKPFNSRTAVMSVEANPNRTSITAEDVKALKFIYKP